MIGRGVTRSGFGVAMGWGAGSAALCPAASGVGSASGRLRRRSQSQRPSNAAITPPIAASGTHSGQTKAAPLASVAGVSFGRAGGKASPDETGVSSPLGSAVEVGAGARVTGPGRNRDVGRAVTGAGLAGSVVMGAGVGAGVVWPGKGNGIGRAPAGGGGIMPSGGPCTRPEDGGAGAVAIIVGGVAKADPATNNSVALSIGARHLNVCGGNVSGTSISVHYSNGGNPP